MKPYWLPYFVYTDTPGSGSGGGGDDDAGELSQDLADLGDPDDDAEGKDDDDAGSDDDDSSGGKDDDADDGSDDDAEEEEEQEDEEEEEEDDKEKEKDDKEDDDKEVERDANGRPTVKAIKTVYPELFKRFPDLKRAYFVLPEFEKVFADPAEAQFASAKAQEFDAMEADLVGKGDPTSFVKTLLENNPKALKKLLSNFPDVVREEAPDEYIALTRPIIEELLFFASESGKKTNNKNLVLAAKHVANWIFNNGGEIPTPTRRSKAEPTEAEKELATERAKNRTEKLNGAAKRAMDEAEPVINGIIDSKLKGLTKFERSAIRDKVWETVHRTLNTDKSFSASMGRLWAQAEKSNFDDASVKRVKEAWLARARNVAITTRNRLRQEALGERSGESGKDDKGGKKRTFPNSGGQARRQGKGVVDPKKINWSKTSDMDILNS